VREQDRRDGASATFFADPALGDLPPDVQVVIYRVAQEALVNAARHSGATRIEVSLERQPGAVSLLVTDNGSGFAFAEEGKGLGLSGMRERALLVGGKLDIDSRPGKGTTVRLEVPIREEAAPEKDAEATGELHAASASGIGLN
jgi:two-component system sensor histidine kinase UhpB